MRRSKRLAVDIDYLEDLQPDAHPQPAPIHRHTDYATHSRGISSQQSFLTIDEPPATQTTEPTSLPNPPPDQHLVSQDDHSQFEPIDYNDDMHLADPMLKARMRKHTAQDNPMLVWMDEWDEFVQEFLRLEAPEFEWAECASPDCPNPPLYRCPQCSDVRLFCHLCIVWMHLPSPFHTVEIWNSRFFEHRTLRSLGLCIQLEHAIGQQCPNPTPLGKEGFTVISSHGIVVVNMVFCNCSNNLSKPVQLLRARLFPATTISPHTAATFEVLRLFQLLTFGSKVSGFEFYQCLVRLTDNLGNVVADRYNIFMCIVCQWRHIRTMKRFGRGHDPSGIEGTSKGECAVLCPACPHPGKNLPSDYSSVPAQKRWIYSLFLAIDANFRLKRLSASSDIRDPGLSRGFAYFVEEKKYKEFLSAYTDLVVPEASTCSDYDAVKLASIRGGKGVSASGVGTIECARHDMKRPLSVGDLQLGEKYVNMDYLYFSSIRNHSPSSCFVSYDIACQWTRKLGNRVAVYPDNVVHHFFAGSKKLSKCVPNTLALSRAFSDSLPTNATLAFSCMVWDFESRRSTVNPYEPKLAIESQAKVRLKLAEEDAAAIAQDDNMTIHETVSPSVLISQGLKLQDQQVRLSIDAKSLGPHSTELQKSQLVERRTRLQRRIVAWCRIQELYMPCVVPLRNRAEEAAGGSSNAEHIKLFLPSDVIRSARFDYQLARYEWRLRHGQAFDDLAELRRHLLVLSTMYQSKDSYVRGQKNNTRSVTLIKNVQGRINYVAQKYRACRLVLTLLSGPLEENGWERSLQPLLDTDIRSLREGEDASSSEGRRQLSWIWSTQRTSDAEITEGMNEVLRIEWCKARARAQRWQEECILLQEEMRRVIVFHEYYGDLWKTRAETVTAKGAQAYAWQQRQTRLTLIAHCKRTWTGVEAFVRAGEGEVSAGESLVETHTRAT
ncbi:hypothetical protein PLEOSDRAFT_1106392 [Pleurotus ostreatus PC15]|uniref:CxC2-like cysteine cluster KDZ transposase-associated domain-containing protein n=1 Tax=Pleurotus ostreatus (strain PC15) TaxID=1137138 RepID=A0A067NC90_PLEO1|nr:hypothetical protein PLEOSDRAFT_1106392 [Pleurotus ostreatus PC15]